MAGIISRELLCQLAKRHGIQTEFTDAFGNTQAAPNSTLIKILSILGCNVNNNADIVNEIQYYDTSKYVNKIDPVAIVWNKNELIIDIYLFSNEINKIINCNLAFENGESITSFINLNNFPIVLTETINNKNYHKKQIKIKDKVEYGYHQLSISIDQRIYHCFVISAPYSAYMNDHCSHKKFGLFVPIYALHTRHAASAGTLTTFKHFITWAAKQGASLIGTLPLSAAFFDDHFYEPSPYSPASRLFWNEFYLDVDLNIEPTDERLVDYKEIMKFKRAGLERNWQTIYYDKAAWSQLEKYTEDNPDLNLYASFRAKMEHDKTHHLDWSDEDHREVLQCANRSANFEYHRYVQWLMDHQLSDLKNHAKHHDILLYLDMPVGVNSLSYDTWRYRDEFVFEAAMGAPPDVLFSKGQNWGMPPLHPSKIRRSQYNYFRKFLSVLMKKIHMLRIDHIISFHRLFWIPHTFPASEGAYVEYPAEEIYAILCLESHRHQVILVGENLGTVPDYINKSLIRHGIYQMYILQYELEGSNSIDYQKIPERSIAGLNTHDMPPFAAYQLGLDIQTRQHLDLITEDKVTNEKSHRNSQVAALSKHLHETDLLHNYSSNEIKNLFIACLMLLAISPAEYLLINLEDIWLEIQPQNVPSTSLNYPNWQKKTRFDFETITIDPSIISILNIISIVRPKPHPAINHCITSDDIYLFNEGNHIRLYEKLGAHYINHNGVKGVHFAVWAPNAKSVSVVGDFNDWNKNANILHPTESSGIWRGFVVNAAIGHKYKFLIHSLSLPLEIEKSDPFGYYHEQAPGNASIIWNIDYVWHDQEWLNKRHCFNHRSPISIYELHIGSWRRVPEENFRFLTYRELAPVLTDYVIEMGYTHVEFLPVMEHPFYGSWGYQISGYFSPTSRYGQPQDFMYLIDYLHQHNIGVILDWVPSHFPCDEHGLAFFDGTYLYEHADKKQGYHPDWKTAIFNYGRNEVQSFLISSAMFWLDKYHADGIRVDAVASMLYLDYSRLEHEWVPNQYGGRENLDAVSFLKKLNETVYRHYPDVHMIAEESTAWQGVSHPTFAGGLGFGFKWDMGWMHDTLQYFKRDPIHRSYHHNELTFRMNYAYSENYILPLSHDETVHGKGSLLGRMPGNDTEKIANLRLLLGFMYAQPGKKLLFMGNDIAQWHEWNHEQSIDWHLLQYDRHQQIQLWVKKLNHIYCTESALHEFDCHPNGFEWIDHQNNNQNIFCFARKSQKDVILIILNTAPIVWNQFRIGTPESGNWQELINSDDVQFGGKKTTLSCFKTVNIPSHHRACSIELNIPAYGIVFLKHYQESRSPT